jgi:hypothetical protein
MRRRHSKTITFYEISNNFRYNLKEAAINLGISSTQLKRLCREQSNFK